MSTSIVAIGSANTEQILVVDQMKIGTKCNCKRVEKSYGGSAVNWAIRLKTLNVEQIDQVYVACPVGGDVRGEYIRDELTKSNITVVPNLSLGPDKKTNHSFIVVCGDERTVYTRTRSAVNTWAMNLAENIEIEIPSDVPLITMIGNIAKSCDTDADACLITKQVIEALSRKNTSYIYANFGRAQYSFCYHYWTKVWNQIDFFQLNAGEAREFISRTLDCDCCRELLTGRGIELPPNLSLYSILKFFKEINTTTVITLAGSGSVAVTRAGNEIIFTWPRKPTQHLDTTGSGDAFGTGVIWALLVHKKGTIEKAKDYADIFSEGSFWAAHACKEYGGCNGTPDTNEIITATESHKEYPSIRRNIKEAEPLLYMLDKKRYYFES